MGVGHEGVGAAVGRAPLLGPGGAFRQLPLEPEEVIEVGHVPLGRLLRPRPFEARCDRMRAAPGFIGAGPAEALFGDGAAFRLWPDMGRRPRAMRLAEGVAAGDQGDGFLVVHRHAAEGVADVAGGGQRVRVAVRPFRVDVDQAHLHGGEGVFQQAVAGITLVVEPGVFGPPVDVLLRLPMVGAAEGETEGGQAHVLDRDGPGEDHQVAPGNRVAVFLLDRPEQAARLVQVAVVGPGVQRREALGARRRPAAPVGGAVGAGGMPRHAHEERAVMAPVGGPPVLAVGHQRQKVGLQRVDVERLERLRVVEIGAERVRAGQVLGQDLQVQLVRPPVAVRPRAVGAVGAGVAHRAAAHRAAVVAVHDECLLAAGLVRGRRSPRRRLGELVSSDVRHKIG